MQALIIVYPVVTLLWLVTLTVEYALRKAMYYRLLSMRILVDWENKKVRAGAGGRGQGAVGRETK